MHSTDEGVVWSSLSAMLSLGLGLDVSDLVNISIVHSWPKLISRMWSVACKLVTYSRSDVHWLLLLNECSQTGVLLVIPKCNLQLFIEMSGSKFLVSERELTFTFAICCRPSVCHLSVCNVRAPYSGGSNFRQYFYGIRYLRHPLTSTENFTEIVSGKPIRWGELNTRGVAKYSDFGPIEGHILETEQDRR